MKNPPAILGKIAQSTIKRVEDAKKSISSEALIASVNSVVKNNKLSFHNALAAPGLSFICEVKKASPSKGVISADFPWRDIAKDYDEGGAAAISVLTEPEFFLGSDQYLREISAAVKIPTLRKDFIIDPYQIYEAKLWGAKAVLLICALLEPETLSSFIACADELALDCLVEIHSEEEAKEAIGAGAKIIGINNRDLTTFNVDTSLASRLKKIIPAEILTVAESGINNVNDIRKLKETGVDAVLIGESLMRSANRKQFLKELLSA
ncbi:MAG: indole-3-glycerol phosphate synthase TrpC [Treponema sp.]|nr:indole-3-glycerol phosphate synthase TrpC [Treponema sp.]